MDPDTEGTFRPERIAEIAVRFGGKLSTCHLNGGAKKNTVDPEQACENISFARCMNSEVSRHLALLKLY